MEDLSREFMQQGAKNERDRINEIINELEKEDLHFVDMTCKKITLTELRLKINITQENETKENN